MLRKIIPAAVAGCALFASAAMASTTYPNLLGKAEQAGNFKTFVKAAKAAGLDGALTGSDKWTVFAPTDEAFAKLPAGTLERLMKPENKEELAKLLKNHIIPGQVFASTWANETAEVKSTGGSTLKIEAENYPFRVNGATVIDMNVFATNGKIHAIDKVITN